MPNINIDMYISAYRNGDITEEECAERVASLYNGVQPLIIDQGVENVFIPNQHELGIGARFIHPYNGKTYTYLSSGWFVDDKVNKEYRKKKKYLTKRYIKLLEASVIDGFKVIADRGYYNGQFYVDKAKRSRTHICMDKLQPDGYLIAPKSKNKYLVEVNSPWGDVKFSISPHERTLKVNWVSGDEMPNKAKVIQKVIADKLYELVFGKEKLGV